MEVGNWNKEGRIGDFTEIEVSDEIIEDYPEYTDDKGRGVKPKSVLGNLYREVVKVTTLTYITSVVILGTLSASIYGLLLFSIILYGAKYFPESLTGILGNADSPLYGSSRVLVVPATIFLIFSTLWVIGWKSKDKIRNLTMLMTVMLFPLVIPMRMTRNKKDGIYQSVKEEIEHKVKVSNVFKGMLHDKELKENEGYSSLRKKKKDADELLKRLRECDEGRFHEDLATIEYEEYSNMYDNLVINLRKNGEYQQIYLRDMKSIDYLYNVYEPEIYLNILEYMYASVIDELNKLVELPNGYVTRKYNILTSKEDGVYFTTDFKEVYSDYTLVDCEPITKDTLKDIMELLERNQENIKKYNQAVEYQKKLEEDELKRIEYAKEVEERKEDYLNKREDIKNKLLLNSIGDSWLDKEKEIVKDKVKINKDFVELNR